MHRDGPGMEVACCLWERGMMPINQDTDLALMLCSIKLHQQESKNDKHYGTANFSDQLINLLVKKFFNLLKTSHSLLILFSVGFV